MQIARLGLRRALLLVLLPAAAVAAPTSFDIERQPADAALTQFARQAGIPVLFPFDLVSGRTANAVRGQLEPRRALELLLDGTGLEAKTDSRGQITVRERQRRRTVLGGLVARLEQAKAEEAARQSEPVVEITVSGSRIERDGMVTPTPVTAIHASELQSLGPAALIDALVQLPQFLNSDTPQTQSFTTAGAAGASYLNLRGLGANRTLLLLDGRRIVPTTGAGAVDVALLPKALLRTVEVVTGGASAAYGSDAVSGVVNLLLDTESDGLKVRMQGGISSLGDAGHAESSVSWGGAVGERSRLVLSAEWNRTDGVHGYGRRSWFDSWSVIPDPAPNGGPALHVVRDVRSSEYTYGGLIPRGPLAGTQFVEGGVAVPFVRGALAGPRAQVGGSGVDPGRDYVWIHPDQVRASGFAKLETIWDGGTTTFLQLLTGFSDNQYAKDPSSQWGAWEATIRADNPYLPESIREAMRGAGVDTFPLARMSPDLGTGYVHNRSHLYSATGGFEALIGRGWELAGFVQHGRNDAELAFSGVGRVDRIYRAFDTVRDPRSGEIVCRSTLTFPDDGCVPANPFGPDSITPAARDYMTAGTAGQDQRVTQQAAELKVQGPALSLPAGPASLAFGTGWRRESVSNTPERWPEALKGRRVPASELEGYQGLPAAYTNSLQLFERVVASMATGQYSVWEVFGESEVPLLSDSDGTHRFDFNAAARYARYTGSGGSLAWKGGLDWRLGSQLRLRGTRSRDVRAGTLFERFDASRVGSTIIDRQAPGSPTYVANVVRRGDPTIDPERSDTLTFGAVLQPGLVPGLSMSLDYFDIRVSDAIAYLGAQTILDRCQLGDATFCSLITRDAATGLASSIDDRALNIAEARARGLDLEVSMRRRITLLGGNEALSLRLLASRMLEASTTPFAAPKIDRAGQTGLPGGAPRWQANAALVYERGPLQLALHERLISGGTYGASFGPHDIDDNSVGSAAYTHLRASFRVGQDPESLLIYANVINLFDRAPPLAPGWGFVGSTHTNEALFDAVGRRYVLGFRLRR